MNDAATVAPFDADAEDLRKAVEKMQRQTGSRRVHCAQVLAIAKSRGWRKVADPSAPTQPPTKAPPCDA